MLRSAFFAVRIMNRFPKEKVSPLIGSSRVSTVPMSALETRIAAQRHYRGKHLLLHPNRPNVPGQWGCRSDRESCRNVSTTYVRREAMGVSS